LNRRQVDLEHAQANFLAELSAAKLSRSDFDSALRLASRGTRIDLALPADKTRASPAAAALAAAVSQAIWRFALGGHDGAVTPGASGRTDRKSSRRQTTRPPASGMPRAPRRSRSCAAMGSYLGRGNRHGNCGRARPWRHREFRRLQPGWIAHRHG